MVIGAIAVVIVFACFIVALVAGEPPELWGMGDDETRVARDEVDMFKEDGEDLQPPTGRRK
jgi:hypothetical protein